MVALAAAAVALTPSFAVAQSGEPAWSQFQGGPGRPGTAGAGPAPPYRVRWSLPAPEGRALSGAVILGDLAMTVGQRDVYAVDLSSGDVAWHVPRAGGPLSIPAVVTGAGRRPDVLLYLEGPDTGSGAASPTPTTSPGASPSSSPTRSGGSELVAIDLGDQTELWRTALGAASRTGVTVDADSAYVADDAGTVYAIAIRDGTVEWSRDLEGQGPCEPFAGGRIDGAVAVAGGRVVSVARDNDAGSVAVSAYDATSGECTWRAVSTLGTSAASAPAASGDLVIVGLGDRSVRALGSGDGQQVWSTLALSLFLPVSSPALGEGALYVVDVGAGLYRFDPADGAEVWDHQLNDQVVRSSPVVSGGAVLVGLDDGRLVALDAGSGHLVWQSPEDPGLVGAIAVSGDVIVAVKGGADAGLIAFESDPDGRLVDVASPTELEVGTTLGRFALAAAIVLLVVLGPGLLARRRFPGPFAGDEDADEMAEEVT